MAELEPFYENVQAHYDLSNEFFATFLDPSMTYSCAYFEREGMTLAEAQLAKIELSLGKCDLRRGMRLLDIGCGWGATLRRAAERYGVQGIGLTLSKNQLALAQEKLRVLPPTGGGVDLRLQGWEEFDEPVDRIVSIGAFEHFRRERYPAFFSRCYGLLPTGGRMMLHTILMPDQTELSKQGIEVNHGHVLFAKFIRRHIFPGGQLCSRDFVIRHAEAAGFRVALTQSLRPHYALTLDHWARNLEAAKAEAIRLTSPEVFDLYMRYLTGCAAHFRSGHLDVMQFTLCRD
ncbi:MAG: class I SAM-dependent methyltransferase [Planctomycetes bacterium]|nr:class I SAM-dependent methyltransferase [Planctomycetota bacterium]